MKKICGTFLLVAGMILTFSVSFAQLAPPNPAPVFNCIGALTAGCSDGTISLRQYNNAGIVLSHVSVAGYYAAVTASGTLEGILAGGGEFTRIGSINGSPPVCVSAPFTDAKGTVGSAVLTDLGSTNGLTVGELVTGDGTSADIHVAPGAEIASIPSPSKVTLTLPLTGTATGSNIPISGTFTGDNTGTLIVDAGGDCYQKTDYRGDPHEFGAYGDGNAATPHDDTAALQNWLGAYGNVFSGAPSAAPNNFGPWDATIPANYVTNAQLYCPSNANLRAPANDSRWTSLTPIVQISAGKTFPNTGTAASPTAVLTLNAQCRMSGLSINAQCIATAGCTDNNFVDAVNIAGKAAVIDGHALLEHGYYV